LNGVSEIESMRARHIHCTGTNGSTRSADRSMRLRPGFGVRTTLKRATCSFIGERIGWDLFFAVEHNDLVIPG
jgi:hypothetical protein